MSLVRDDSVEAQVPKAAIAGLDVSVTGRVLGASKPHVFLFGTLEGRPYLLFLSEGLAGPFSDSDGGFASIRYDGRGRANVLVIQVDAAGVQGVAYERVSSDV